MLVTAHSGHFNPFTVTVGDGATIGHVKQAVDVAASHNNWGTVTTVSNTTDDQLFIAIIPSPRSPLNADGDKAMNEYRRTKLESGKTIAEILFPPAPRADKKPKKVAAGGRH